MSLVESLDRMSINRKYRKYKPTVSLKKSPQAWWRYAIQAVREEDVKRRAQMWSWKHIKEHRLEPREYVHVCSYTSREEIEVEGKEGGREGGKEGKEGEIEERKVEGREGKREGNVCLENIHTVNHVL